MKYSCEKGVALVFSLIMLLLMTLLAIYAMRTSTMEEKMAGNSRDQALAMFAAETALRDAEEWIASQTSAPAGSVNGANRVWTKNAMDPDSTTVENWWQERDTTWWHNNATQYTGAISTVKTKPYTIIEYLGKDKITQGSSGYGSSNINLIHYYRITALGTGGSDQSRALLQSTYYGEW